MFVRFIALSIGLFVGNQCWRLEEVMDYSL